MRHPIRNLSSALLEIPALTIPAMSAMLATSIIVSATRSNGWNGLHWSWIPTAQIWAVTTIGLVATMWLGAHPDLGKDDSSSTVEDPSIDDSFRQMVLKCAAILFFGGITAFTLAQISPPLVSFPIRTDPAVLVQAPLTVATCERLVAADTEVDGWPEMLSDCQGRDINESAYLSMVLIFVTVYLWAMAVFSRRSEPVLNRRESFVTVLLLWLLSTVVVFLIVGSETLRSGVLVGWITVATIGSAARTYWSWYKTVRHRYEPASSHFTSN